MVLASAGRFYLVDRTAGGIGAIRTIRPQPLAPPGDSNDVAADTVGWTDPANPIFSAGEIFRDAQMVVLRIVEASRYDTTAAPTPTAMYWLAIQLRGALTWYDSATLGDVVTRTLRQAQERARERYQQELDALVPREIVECQQVVREALDRAALIDGTA